MCRICSLLLVVWVGASCPMWMVLAQEQDTEQQEADQQELMELRQFATDERGDIDEQLLDLKDESPETPAQQAMADAAKKYLQDARNTLDELLAIQDAASLPKARQITNRLEMLQTKWWITEESDLEHALLMEELESFAEDGDEELTQLIDQLRNLHRQDSVDRKKEFELSQKRLAAERKREELHEKIYELLDDEDDVAVWIDHNRVSFNSASPVPIDVGQVTRKIDRVLRAHAVPRADDAVFLRRVWLDLGGTIPPVDHVDRFLSDTAPGKRIRLIERLLASRYYADCWSHRLTTLLTDCRPVYQYGVYNGRSLQMFLLDSLQQNKPYDQIVTELLTSTGVVREGSPDQPAPGSPVNFLMRYETDPVELTKVTSRAFLGTSLECAQCHDHPFAHWKQDEFHALAAVFGRVQQFYHDSDDTGGDESYVAVVMQQDFGEYHFAKGSTGEEEETLPVVVPQLPGMTDSLPADAERTQAMAAWLTAADNPYFARNFVNKAWGLMLGTPLVASLDDPAGLSKSASVEILNLLAEDFASNGYDVKRLLAAIAETRAYQSAANRSEQNSAVAADFASPSVRPLTADQLYSSVNQACNQGLRDQFPLEEGDSSLDPPVEAVGEYALSYTRSLLLRNSEHMTSLVMDYVGEDSGEQSVMAQIRQLYLATLSRPPGRQELAVMTQLVEQEKNGRGLEDALWVVLNSAEFNTNH